MSQPAASTVVEIEEVRKTYERCKSIMSTFAVAAEEHTPILYWHKEESWYAGSLSLTGSMVAQHHFKARPTDIILATLPKSGTTWTKALLFAIANRDSDNPLANYTHPHGCVPFLEISTSEGLVHIDSLPSPRMLSTHVPFHVLPKSVGQSKCRIVYVWRDPKATFTSYYHFMAETRKNNTIHPTPIETICRLYCEGVSIDGPFWDHILGYSKACTNNNNMLFLKYEDMMRDPVEHVKKLAEFIGKPFTAEEEEQGLVEKIVGLCSIESLKNLEVNKFGSTKIGNAEMKHNMWFRKGVVDDWKNHLTPDMAARLDEITGQKFRGSGLAIDEIEFLLKEKN